MDIREKFLIGKDSRTYQRVSEEHNIDIFLGYNDSGNMSLVITEKGKLVKVKSTKIIDVSLNKRVDGKLALSFDLLDDIFENYFIVFCKDIVINCQNVSKENVISYCVERWNYWKEMFQQDRKQKLDENQIKGLIGELLFLQEYMIPKFGQKEAVISWSGPLKAHKDFEINDTWYEVKSVFENSMVITISSLEQLESENEGHLVVVRLEKANEVTDGITGLNLLVNELATEIKDIEVLNIFMKKVKQVGYYYDEIYESYLYLHKGNEIYTVNESFPRIQRKQLSRGIGNASYTIILDSIYSFREE